jgi:hypothetical protein
VTADDWTVVGSREHLDSLIAHISTLEIRVADLEAKNTRLGLARLRAETDTEAMRPIVTAAMEWHFTEWDEKAEHALRDVIEASVSNGGETS